MKNSSVRKTGISKQKKNSGKEEMQRKAVKKITLNAIKKIQENGGKENILMKKS